MVHSRQHGLGFVLGNSHHYDRQDFQERMNRRDPSGAQAKPEVTEGELALGSFISSTSASVLGAHEYREVQRAARLRRIVPMLPVGLALVDNVFVVKAFNSPWGLLDGIPFAMLFFSVSALILQILSPDVRQNC